MIDSDGMMLKTPATHAGVGVNAATFRAWMKFFWPPKLGASASMMSASR